MGLTRDQIRERLKVVQLTLGTSPAAFFAAVPEEVKRNIVALYFSGDGQNRNVTIEKLEEDGTTYTEKFTGVQVNSAANVQLPSGKLDYESPILVLEGGTRLYGVSSAGAPEATVIYWDDELED